MVCRFFQNIVSVVLEFCRRVKAAWFEPTELLRLFLELMLQSLAIVLAVVGVVFIPFSPYNLITSPWPEGFLPSCYNLIVHAVLLVGGFVCLLFAVMVYKTIASLMEKDDAYIIGFFSAFVSFAALVVAMISLAKQLA